MPTYDVLKVEYNACPPDCNLCEQACIREQEGSNPGLSRIKRVHIPSVNFSGALTCIQCSQPRCQLICPAGAIEKSRVDGTVRVDGNKCVGCGLCTVACPYGGIYFDQEARRAFKCNRCDGDPKCVAACPYHLISYVRNAPVMEYMSGEDLLSPGVSACSGCLAELALRFTLRVLGKNTVIFTAPGCASAWLHGMGEQPGGRLARFHCLLTNVASSMTGAALYYQSQGRDVNVVSFVGDGATVDIGFQALSGAAERGNKIIYICYDNEGYMNTGVQRSASTPFAARTTTTPVGKNRRGKEQVSKYLPLLMLLHGVPYVATASIAYPEDYARKLNRAMKVKDGLSYIHLFLPCTTGWGYPEDEGLEVSRLAVETNYFPLWDGTNGELRLTHEVKSPEPLQKYLDRAAKFTHLTEDEVQKIQEQVNSRYRKIKALASTDGISG